MTPLVKDLADIRSFIVALACGFGEWWTTLSLQQQTAFMAEYPGLSKAVPICLLVAYLASKAQARRKVRRATAPKEPA